MNKMSENGQKWTKWTRVHFGKMNRKRTKCPKMNKMFENGQKLIKWTCVYSGQMNYFVITGY